MKILFFNEFTSIKGGVDSVVEKEIELLRESGLEVEIFSYRNDDFLALSLLEKLKIVNEIRKGKFLIDEINSKIQEFKPDIIHFHNIYNLFSFPVWAQINREKAKIIQHLHNYYPFCLNSFQFRNKKKCTLCYEKDSFLPGIINRCYNNSFSRTLFTNINRASPKNYIKLANKFVDVFISPSEYILDIYKQAGIDPTKMRKVNNFHDFSQNQIRKNSAKKNILYLGNLVFEKGIETLVAIIKENPEYFFVIAGEGRDKDYLLKKLGNTKNFNYVGYVTGAEKTKLFNEASVFLFPTQLDEPAPLVVIEALSYGVPVLTSGRGGVSEYIQDGVNGFIINDNSPEKYSKNLKILLNNSEMFEKLSKNSYLFGLEFSLENHIKNLLFIYNNLCSNLYEN